MNSYVLQSPRVLFLSRESISRLPTCLITKRADSSKRWRFVRSVGDRGRDGLASLWRVVPSFRWSKRRRWSRNGAADERRNGILYTANGPLDDVTCISDSPGSIHHCACTGRGSRVAARFQRRPNGAASVRCTRQWKKRRTTVASAPPSLRLRFYASLPCLPPLFPNFLRSFPREKTSNAQGSVTFHVSRAIFEWCNTNDRRARDRFSRRSSRFNSVELIWNEGGK